MITAFLLDAGADEDPKRLAANRSRAFQGSIVLGLGFVFAEGSENPPALMRTLIANNPRNAQRIRPYLGGEDFNTNPAQEPARHIIDFGEMSEDEARQWPELWRHVEEKVRPERITKDAKKYPRMVNEWWKYWNSRPELQRATASLGRVLACAQTSKYRCFAYASANIVYDQKLIVVADDSFASFAVLQSRLHELWALTFGSTMKDDPVYTPTDCFETFPFPANWVASTRLELIGRGYHEFRAAFVERRSV